MSTQTLASRSSGSRTQFGASGYWIDFAAQHLSRRGQMVLAIECDGVAYHASPTARNRDRLRQDHLEQALTLTVVGKQEHRRMIGQTFEAVVESLKLRRKK